MNSLIPGKKCGKIKPMIVCKCGHEIPEQDPQGNEFPKSLLCEMIKRHIVFDHNKKKS